MKKFDLNIEKILKNWKIHHESIKEQILFREVSSVDIFKMKLGNVQQVINSNNNSDYYFFALKVNSQHVLLLALDLFDDKAFVNQYY